MYIDGAFTAAAAGGTRALVDPSTDRQLAFDFP